MSIVTCREVLEYYETSYFGENYFLFYLKIYIVINKIYKTKNRVFHWCVFSSVNR